MTQAVIGRPAPLRPELMVKKQACHGLKTRNYADLEGRCQWKSGREMITGSGCAGLSLILPGSALQEGCFQAFAAAPMET
jgi:hypothetical protein